MKNKDTIELDSILDQVSECFWQAIDCCNKTITSETKEPFRLIGDEHRRYKAVLKYYRAIAKGLPGYSSDLFRATDYRGFFHLLDSKTKQMIISNNPVETFYVFYD